jgi:hypothetical protein
LKTSGTSRRRGVLALWCFVVVGCAEVANAPPREAITAAETTPVATTPPVSDTVTPEPATGASTAGLADSAADSIEELSVATEPEHELPPVAAAEIGSATSELAVEPAAPATEALVPEPSLAPSVVASPASVAALDFSSLVTRLRKTKAINLRTKVAVKNESDDLLELARAYHARTGTTTLADLRRSYDALFQELHTLLEEADPPLAHDIDRSRAAIWEILMDASKFNAAI